MAIEQRQVIYAGNVQGVGFRYRTRVLAGNFNVQGWVRNCDDGTVEINVQGAEQEINDFLAAVEQAMGGCITTRRITAQTPEAPYRNFVVRG